MIFQRRVYLVGPRDEAHLLVLSFEDPGGQGRCPEGEAVLDSYDPPHRLAWPVSESADPKTAPW